MNQTKSYLSTNNVANKLISIFLLSISLFIYEILITRLFSTILYYHFVFLATSIAILGSGLGGAIVYRSKRQFAFETLTLALSLSYLIGTLLIYKLPFIDLFILYSLLTSIPFIIGGMILALAFKEQGSISNKLYFSDLLGSTIGSLLVIPFMDKLGFMTTLFLVSIISLFSSILFSFKKKGASKIRLASVLLLVIGFGMVFQREYLVNIEKDFTAYLTSPTTLLNYSKEHGNTESKILFTKWDSISRTDVVEENNKERTIITDGGASAPMMQFNGNLDSIQHMKKDIEFLPFTLGNNDDTLIIGSGGGKDVLYALLGGSTSIDAIEINPSTIDAVKEFKEFNGDIYNYEGVNLFIEDGRNFIEKTDKKYNNIYLSMVMTNAVSNGGLSLSENYIYTKEAFQTYLEHLKDNGYLSFMFHGSSDMLRGINTGIEALIEMGVKQENVNGYFLAINSLAPGVGSAHGDGISMPIVVFKRTPFTETEVNNVMAAVNDQQRSLINMPGVGYLNIYEEYSNNKISMEEIYDSFNMNLKATTDNKPFFYDFGKGIPGTISVLLVIVAILAFIMYFMFSKGNKNIKPFWYFSALGIGFMLIETPLIQKSILFLGNPSRAFSFILFSILLSCGIGSYFSNKKIFSMAIKEKQIIFLLIPSILILQLLIMPVLIENFRGVNDILKLFIMTAYLLPLGFFMGMAFPKGIAKLNLEGKESIIPLVYATNGVMSVAGSVIAIALSMTLGFTATMILGGLVYLSIFIFKL